MAGKKHLWTKKPESTDYQAARRFLSLIYPGDRPQKLVRVMRKAKTVEQVAKDLLRASGLPLLPRAEMLVVADGYHRICAICHFDEDAPVRCRIVEG